MDKLIIFVVINVNIKMWKIRQRNRKANDVLTSLTNRIGFVGMVCCGLEYAKVFCGKSTAHTRVRRGGAWIRRRPPRVDYGVTPPLFLPMWLLCKMITSLAHSLSRTHFIRSGYLCTHVIFSSIRTLNTEHCYRITFTYLFAYLLIYSHILD